VGALGLVWQSGERSFAAVWTSDRYDEKTKTFTTGWILDRICCGIKGVFFNRLTDEGFERIFISDFFEAQLCCCEVKLFESVDFRSCLLNVSQNSVQHNNAMDSAP
jgi:hypothetical protein